MQGNDKRVIKTLIATKSLFPNNNRHLTVSKKSTNAQKESGIDSEAVKITVVMVIVNIVFIVSCLPYFLLVVWRVFKRQHEAEFLSDAGLVWFKIGSRSGLLSTVVSIRGFTEFSTAILDIFSLVGCVGSDEYIETHNYYTNIWFPSLS
ncbi:hypothetical protein DPMN_169440 [Dreissena polymorpha]|uniref:Uncharacterized protein n=1 Tax=Dreissena polymorpha TaxID=45954 RepID=A0A9D4IDM4_DREPO|nr:hypothetical protein DPMN_169440 [Dreissena polymorpha]